MSSIMDNVKQHLKNVVSEAKTRIDLDSAHNPALRKAIQIVEAFLQRSSRVCYGGQAINAQLPEKYQFYDPTTSLPDYDFFSPDSKGDIDILLDDLKAAGYTEISKRIGIHEGTVKIYVNYTAIADITDVIPEFYQNIYKKSVKVNGIQYADPIFLRMMMYLELSRPRGQVDRWEKVYERLALFNKTHPLHACKGDLVMSKAASIVRPSLVRYMVKNHRAFMGGDVYHMYAKNTSPVSRVKELFRSNVPIVFLSPDANMDADILVEQLDAKKVLITGYQNIIPPMIALYHEDDLVCVIVQEEACHSIVTLPLTKNKLIRVASLETILTFLIGLYYRDDSLIMTQESILCFLKQYIDLSNHFKLKPTKLIPAFSIECDGYQTSFASLLRAKGARIEAARQHVSSGHRTSKGKMTTSRTRSRRSTSQKRKTRRHIHD